MATALVLLFALTAGGILWLARDVDRAVSNRGVAQSVAFQSARTGAQQVDLSQLREWDTVRIDAERARAEATATARQLFELNDLDGVVESISVDGDRITVVVSVREAGRDVTGVGSARATDGRTP